MDSGAHVQSDVGLAYYMDFQEDKEKSFEIHSLLGTKSMQATLNAPKSFDLSNGVGRHWQSVGKVRLRPLSPVLYPAKRDDELFP